MIIAFTIKLPRFLGKRFIRHAERPVIGDVWEISNWYARILKIEDNMATVVTRLSTSRIPVDVLMELGRKVW